MTLSRQQRILLRAERYAKGEIDLQTFFSLEELDETPDVPDEPGELTGLAEAEKKSLSPDPEQARPKPTPKKKHKSKINMTKEEFDKLSLHEQNSLYKEDPDAIEALVKGEE